MSSTTGTPQSTKAKPDVDTAAKPTMTELLRQTGPRGFGTYSSDQRYQEIFEDDSESAPGYRTGSTGGSYQQPFSGAYTGQQTYEDTVVFFHHCKKGIRFSVQANTKTFIVLLAIFIGLMNSPGIGELLNNVLRIFLNAR
jgi:hypothetical protein